MNLLSGNSDPFCRELYLMLTHECPMRCKYCYLDRSKSLADMSWETIVQVMEEFRPKLKGSRGLVFFGGEPLLRLDLIKKTLENYGSNELQTGVVTGGSENLSELYDIWVQYKMVLQISWDGILNFSTRGPGLKFLELKKYFKHTDRRNGVQLRKTISEDNVSSLYEDYLIGKRLNLDYNVSFDFSVVHQQEFSKRFFDSLYDGYNRIWSKIADDIVKKDVCYIPLCLVQDLYHLKNSIGKSETDFENRYSPLLYDSCEVSNVLVVEGNGDVFPCTMLSQVGQEFKMGNVFNDVDLSLRSTLSSSVRCNCPYERVCGGGCRWERFKCYGKSDMMSNIRKSTCRNLHIKYTSAMRFWDGLDGESKEKIEFIIKKYDQSQKLNFAMEAMHEEGKECIADAILFLRNCKEGCK